MQATQPRLSFWQIWNVSFGFLGVQFGFALQNANVSRILSDLGADLHSLSLFWLVAPIMGLIVQPIVGSASDRTWNRLGRRRPFILAGAIAAVLGMILLPNAPLFVAFLAPMLMGALMVALMDASFNVCFQPFRSLVSDMVPPSQRNVGYSIQSLLINIGAVIGSILYGQRLAKTEKSDAVFGNPERAKGCVHWIIVGTSFLVLSWLYYSWDIAKAFYPKSANELCQVAKVNESLLSLKYLFPIEERSHKSTALIKRENINISEKINIIQNLSGLSNEDKAKFVNLLNKTKEILDISNYNEILVNTTINVDEIQVTFPEGHNPEVDLGNEITLYMKYPSMDAFIEANFQGKDQDPFDVVVNCIDKIVQGEEVHESTDCTKKELRDFIDSMTADQFKNIQTFFETMPKLQHKVMITNPKSGVESEITLQGLGDFFGS